MREHITYIAEDGTEFYSKQECLDYEEEKSFVFEAFKKNVHAFSEDGKPIYFEDENDFIYQYDKMTYLEIDENLSESSVKFIEDSGYDPIPIIRGVYWWSSKDYEYYRYDEMWEPIKNIIKKWY